MDLDLRRILQKEIVNLVEFHLPLCDFSLWFWLRCLSVNCIRERACEWCPYKCGLCFYFTQISDIFYLQMSSNTSAPQEWLPFRLKMTLRVWTLPLKGLEWNLRNGDKSLELLTFQEGLAPGTKPFKLVFTRREFSQGLIPWSVYMKKLVPGTNPLNCLFPDSISQTRAPAELNHTCSHSNKNWEIGGEEIHKHCFAVN